jgi:hypothetical protein
VSDDKIEFEVTMNAPAALPEMEVTTGVDHSVVEILEPTLWQRAVRVVRRYWNHVLYKLGFKKY